MGLLPTSASRELDKRCATDIMKWVRHGDHWCEPESRFQRWDILFSPTHEPGAAMVVWIECLKRARDLGYEISMSRDTGGYIHVNGDHPMLARLLTIDTTLPMAMTRFAARLFGIELPPPLDRDAGSAKT